MKSKYYESDLIDFVYDKLFENTQHKNIDFCEAFPNAEVTRDFAMIVLDNQFIIKIERI